MKKKFLCLQLPIPRLKLSAEDHNFPAAAYYLQAYVQQQAIAGAIEIQIFDPAIQNYGSDETILREVLALAPDMIGFSLFCWNIERSLYLAAQIKQHGVGGQIPLILAGGPEVTKDNPLLHQTAIDLYVYGEGEVTLTAILAAWLADGQIPLNLPGTMYTQQVESTSKVDSTATTGQQADTTSEVASTLFVNPPQPQAIDLNATPSAYLQGLVPRERVRHMFFETMRGCPFACHFCYYHKNSGAIRFLRQEHILALLYYARAHEYEEIFLLDPSFNLRPDLAELLQKMAACNTDHRIKIATELRADLVDEPIAQLLAEAGFCDVEIGLQTIHPATMRKLGRTQNLDAFLRGAQAMSTRGIATKVDLIVGLPGDNLKKFQASARWVKRHGLDGHLQVFCLSVLPGTHFRAHAAELGLKFSPFPPYYLRSSPEWSTREIQEAFRWAEDYFGVTFEPDTDAEWTFPSSEGNGVCSGMPGCGQRLQEILHVAPTQPFTYPAATTSVTKWVIGPILTVDALFTHLAAMQTYTQRNPYGIYQVYLDLRNEIPLDSLMEFYTTFKPIRNQFLDRDLSLFSGSAGPIFHYQLAILLKKPFLPHFSETYRNALQQHFTCAIVAS